jgi:hypothetical protein
MKEARKAHRRPILCVDTAIAFVEQFKEDHADVKI